MRNETRSIGATLNGRMWRFRAHAPAVLLVAVAVATWFGLVKPNRAAGTSGLPAVPSAPIDFTGELRGSRQAPIGIMMFSEFQCPFCGRFAREVFPELDRTYVAHGQVAVAFRQFPLQNIHPYAAGAAAVAKCAGKLGHFWEYHDALFAQQSKLDDELPWSVAGSLGLDTAFLHRCALTEGPSAVKVDLDLGRTLSISGTPTFFVGKLSGDKLTVAKVLVGARPAADFSSVIDGLTKPIDQ